MNDSVTLGEKNHNCELVVVLRKSPNWEENSQFGDVKLQLGKKIPMTRYKLAVVRNLQLGF